MADRRDQQLLDIALEAVQLYWGSGKAHCKAGTVCLALPVLDGEAEFKIQVHNGVFSIRSQLPGLGEQDPGSINQINSEMKQAAFHYLLEGGHLYLQSKLAVPDLRLEPLHAPALRIAWQAGWRAACGESGAHGGASSYDQFVFLADLLTALITEQWYAQQGAATILIQED